MNEELKQIKEDYIREIIRYYREKGITDKSVEALDTMIHSAKNLCKIIEGYEEKGGYSMTPAYSYGWDMNDYSYARGRGANASRDSMGRYSSAGYSGHGEVLAGLHDLMNRTSDEGSRRELQTIIDNMSAR